LVLKTATNENIKHVGFTKQGYFQTSSNFFKLEDEILLSVTVDSKYTYI